jgi:hypothetical protein
MTATPAPLGDVPDVVAAPGAQGRLFATECTATRLRFVVVDRDGTRTPPVAHLGTAAAQAHAIARPAGRAWVEGSDGRTVEITLRDNTLIVAPREPGWPATIARLMAEQAMPRQETQ